VVKPLYAQRPSSDERDRGRFYGAVVRRRSRAMGIRDRPTAPALPRQNGFAERMIGLIWRRDIDHIVVLTEALAPNLAILWLLLQLIRTHRLLDKDAPVSRPVQRIVLETLAAYDDRMKSKGLGRWLQGDLHPPK